MKKNISVVIYSHNDEDEIKDCIKSVLPLTKNIYVLDIGSTDETSKIAESMGAKIHKTKFARYVELVREIGINLADTKWVLILDADEVVSEELIKEISNFVSGPVASFLPASARHGNHDLRAVGIPSSRATRNLVYSAFKVPRKNLFAGKKWLRFGGWWPDHQIRLINKDYFVSWSKQIHSTPKIKGDVGKLKNPIIHNFHGDFESMVNKTLIFEDIESDLLYKAGKNASIGIFIRKFLGEFYRRLIKKLGFMDGPVGIIEGIYQAFSKTITYLFLYEKKKNRPLRPLS